ncbi:MAG: hypothetical protein Q4D73_06625 [Actinomycetaceae bacterium]|nr:hypothetical protein [Actinomycetaceae bacterium]
MNFPPLRLDVDINEASLYVAGLKHSTFPTDENLHKVAIDKAFEIVQTHGKDLTLTINDKGKEYRLLLTKNGDTIDQTPQETTAPKKSSKKLKLTGYITLATATLATASFFAVNTLLPAETHIPATTHKQVDTVEQVPQANKLPTKNPQTSIKTPDKTQPKTKQLQTISNSTTSSITKLLEITAKETKKPLETANKENKENKPTTPAPTPTPTPQPPVPAPNPKPPAPTPAPQPAPKPEPEPTAPENFITDMSTNAVSGKGSVTFTVRLVGGNAPVTATIAGRTLTFNGTGTISGIPKGTYTWTTYVDGLSNSGTITIP